MGAVSREAIRARIANSSARQPAVAQNHQVLTTRLAEATRRTEGLDASAGKGGGVV